VDTAAAGALQARLASLWAQVLGVEPVGIHDDFFDLGGDSFLAMRLVRLIQSQLGWKVTVTELFARPTIAELAKLTEAAET
jgi:aryl carrier-like protein